MELDIKGPVQDVTLFVSVVFFVTEHSSCCILCGAVTSPRPAPASLQPGAALKPLKYKAAVMA